MKDEIKTTVELSGEIDIEDLTKNIRKMVKEKIADDMADYILNKYDEKHINRLAWKVIDERFCNQIGGAVYHAFYEWQKGNKFNDAVGDFLKSQKDEITLHFIRDGEGFLLRAGNENK